MEKIKSSQLALLWLAILAMAILSVQCRRSNKVAQAEDALPATPDYNDTTQWYVTDRNGSADIFYIISTETGDYTLEHTAYHHANTYNDSLRTPMRAEMEGVDSLLSGRLNFFSPYYRQCSLQTFLSDSTIARRMPVAIDDVRKAFRHYIEHLNNGRPFILAGFSQGAIILLQLLREMDDNTYRRMVAAYAIGTAITQQQIDECPRIVPASSADDTGVTICYNSVRDTNCESALSKGNVVAINPVNWRTDNQAAVINTEPSPLVPIEQQKKDKLTVRLDTMTHLVLVEGYTATDYVLPLIGQEGNYHSREIWLYRQQLRDNMAHRSKMFQKQYGK